VASLASFIPPDTVRAVAQSSPAYTVNRDRAAVVVHDGFSVWDTYVSIRPALFALSLIGMATSGYIGWKRRKLSWEAKAFYGSAFVGSAVAAYITSPWAFGGAATASPAEQAAGGGMVGWLDSKAAKLRMEDPRFADRAFQRLVNSPGVKPTWDTVDPLVKALIV
jgi:hypothetical protein